MIKKTKPVLCKSQALLKVPFFMMYLVMRFIYFIESISANIITKINILVAQVIFLICGLLVLTLNFSENRTSTQFISNPVFYLAATVFISVIVLFTYLLYRRNLLLWVIRFLEKIRGNHA